MTTRPRLRAMISFLISVLPPKPAGFPIEPRPPLWSGVHFG